MCQKSPFFDKNFNIATLITQGKIRRKRADTEKSEIRILVYIHILIAQIELT